MIVAIGMDPGPTPGLVKLTYALDQLMDVQIVQCTANCALDVLQMWCTDVPAKAELYFQAEKFVYGTKSYRTGSPGARTRDMVGSAVTLVGSSLSQKGAPKGVTTVRTASETKAWGTDTRLDKAGLLPQLVGMKHARDAARHALYTACKEGRITDPLSKRVRRTNGPVSD